MRYMLNIRIKRKSNGHFKFRYKNKNYSKNTKLLGSLPPYYESYYHGPVIPEFTNFCKSGDNLLSP